MIDLFNHYSNIPGKPNAMYAWTWIKRWGPALIMMGLIFLASSIPSDHMPRMGHFDLSVKKAGHLIGYALLGINLIRAQTRYTPKTFWIALLICGLYALSDEFHQSFVPGRHAALLDVVVDLAGSLAGLGLLYKIPFLRKYVVTA